MPRLREAMSDAENVVLESNSVIQFLRPDLYLAVLDFATADFKSSALRFLDRADALIVHGEAEAKPWDHVSGKLIESKPVFRVQPPQYVTPQLLEFVRGNLRDQVSRVQRSRV